MELPLRKNRKYTEAELKTAVDNVIHSKMTVYRASKEFKIPWSTLKDNLDRLNALRENYEDAHLTMSKIGRPFSLSTELEQKLYHYIIQMQELGFGLTVTKIKEMALSLAKAENNNHSFNEEKGSAGWNWWVKYKERYGLSLRTPENLSAGRAICSNPVVLQDFYDKLEEVIVGIDPNQIWNCDETGLMFVNKPSKIVTSVGKKYVYNRTYAEKGTTTTLLGCINAAGCYIPPFIIFKGVRNMPALKHGFMPNTEVRFSPKGWISGELFLDWMQFFVKCIPPARPVVLIMDSHASHVVPPVLEYARSQQIILFTIPAHTSQLLQPLDVSIHRPLKSTWRTEIETYKRKHPCSIPTRYDFHKFFTPTFEKTFTPSNIRAGFRKAGIYPFSRTAVDQDALAPSKLTDKPSPDEMESVTPEEVNHSERNNNRRIQILADVLISPANPAMSENTSDEGQDVPCDPLAPDNLLTKPGSRCEQGNSTLDLAHSLPTVDIPPELVMASDYDQITNMDDLPLIQSITDDESILSTIADTEDIVNITKTLLQSENKNETGVSALRKVRIPYRAPNTYQSFEIIPGPSTAFDTNDTISKINFSTNVVEETEIKVSKVTSSPYYAASDITATEDMFLQMPKISGPSTAPENNENIKKNDPHANTINETTVSKILSGSSASSAINDAVGKILELPKWDPNQSKKRSKRTVPHARCLTPLKPQQDNVSSIFPSISERAAETTKHAQQKKSVKDDIENNKPNTSRVFKRKTWNQKIDKALHNSTKSKQKLKKKKTMKDDDDWTCDTCKGLYSEDVYLKNGAEWISCSFCLKTYHTHCQSQELEANQTIFMCDLCSVQEDED